MILKVQMNRFIGVILIFLLLSVGGIGTLQSQVVINQTKNENSSEEIAVDSSVICLNKSYENNRNILCRMSHSKG